jgi:hypothetical protein
LIRTLHPTLELPRHQEQITGMVDERMGNDRDARNDLEAEPSIERRGTLILLKRKQARPCETQPLRIRRGGGRLSSQTEPSATTAA